MTHSPPKKFLRTRIEVIRSANCDPNPVHSTPIFFTTPRFYSPRNSMHCLTKKIRGNHLPEGVPKSYAPAIHVSTCRPRPFRQAAGCFVLRQGVSSVPRTDPLVSFLQCENHSLPSRSSGAALVFVDAVAARLALSKPPLFFALTCAASLRSRSILSGYVTSNSVGRWLETLYGTSAVLRE